MTEAARRVNPSSLDYWLPKVDPNSELTEEERLRRAEHARKAHCYRMSLKSARARAARKAAAHAEGDEVA
jgi:hypothetical protein